MAEKFIALGHTVLACGRSREIIETLRKTYRPPHDFAAVDVAQETKVEPWAARLLSTHGAPDLLINNAAMINQSAPLWQVPSPKKSTFCGLLVEAEATISGEMMFVHVAMIDAPLAGAVVKLIW